MIVGCFVIHTPKIYAYNNNNMWSAHRKRQRIMIKRNQGPPIVWFVCWLIVCMLCVAAAVVAVSVSDDDDGDVGGADDEAGCPQLPQCLHNSLQKTKKTHKIHTQTQTP